MVLDVVPFNIYISKIYRTQSLDLIIHDKKVKTQVTLKVGIRVPQIHAVYLRYPYGQKARSKAASLLRP